MVTKQATTAFLIKQSMVWKVGDRRWSNLHPLAFEEHCTNHYTTRHHTLLPVLFLSSGVDTKWQASKRLWQEELSLFLKILAIFRTQKINVFVSPAVDLDKLAAERRILWMWLILWLGFFASLFFFLFNIQPGAVKLVPLRHWMHLSYMHTVTSENKFHCTRL